MYPDLDPADVDGWLLSLGKPLIGERNPAELSALIANLAPGKPPRKALDAWVEARAEERERAAIMGESGGAQ